MSELIDAAILARTELLASLDAKVKLLQSLGKTSLVHVRGIGDLCVARGTISPLAYGPRIPKDLMPAANVYFHRARVTLTHRDVPGTPAATYLVAKLPFHTDEQIGYVPPDMLKNVPIAALIRHTDVSPEDIQIIEENPDEVSAGERFLRLLVDQTEFSEASSRFGAYYVKNSPGHYVGLPRDAS